MFRWVGKLVTGYAPAIVIVLLMISMVFALQVPKIEFKTNLSRFLPDNELVAANDRVDHYFGSEHAMHLIYVEQDNRAHDVLTPEALREQYIIYDSCRDKVNIESIISIASILDQLYSVLQPNNYSGLDQLTDEELEGAKTLFFGVLNGTIQVDSINQLLPSSSEFTLDDLRQMTDLFFSKDFDYNSATPRAESTLIIISINGSLKSDLLKQISQNLRDDLNEKELGLTHITLRHTGGYLISSDLDEVSTQSFSLLGVVIIILIAIILLLTFQRISYVLLPLITLALAVIWTFGTILLLGIEFTVITVVIIPLIIGLGVDYSVYISKRYQEELREGKDISEAIESAVSSVGTAMFLAVLTTIIAFMSNITSSIMPVREFGLMSGLGIFYAFFLTLTFHTSMRWLIDTRSTRKPILKKEKELYVVDLGTTTASRSVLHYPVLVMIIVIMVSIGGILFGMNVRTEFNVKDFLPTDWESLETQSDIETSFNGSSFSQAYILLESQNGGIGGSAGSELASVETLSAIYSIVENVKDDTYVVRVGGRPRIETVLDHIENAIKSNSTLGALIDVDNDNFPDDDAAVKTVFEYLLNNSYSSSSASTAISEPGSGTGLELIRSSINRLLYRNPDGEFQATVIRIYIDTEDSEDVREMYDELESDISEFEITGVKTSVTGSVILTVTTMDSLQDSQIISTVISMIFALVILIIIYRNVALGLIAMTPVLISSIWILGTMYILGISINVFTVTITALTIGLGVDYAIHIIERFREESKKYDTLPAIQRTIHNTGSALFISALTTVCGFMVLAISPISPIPPIQHFGIITAMTIIYSSILAVVVIPILLVKWSENNKKLK
jgi:predicted RND superfamily exporter protein